MAEIKKETKVLLNSPFTRKVGRITHKLGDFDTDYLDIKIVDVVTKTGEGENDFILEKKVVINKTPIKDVIDADKDSVGVENIIKQVIRTGDTSLLPIDKGDCNVDLVGAPESLMEVKNLGVEAEKSFKGLPEELVSGMDMASFVNSMSQEKFDQFISAIAERKKKEVVKDE